MNITEFIKEKQSAYMSELFDLLRIPSISTDPAHKKDIIKAAEWIKAKAEKIGFKNVELIWSDEVQDSNPVVVGEFLVDEKLPWLTIYGHYDVQPALPVEEWKSNPFEPEIRDGKIFARGVTDNKGQLYSNLIAAEYYISHVQNKRFNLKLFVEGEEETTGATAEAIVVDPKYKDLVKTDFLYISDGPWASKDTPTVEYSLRGIIYFDLHIRTSDRDMHSGQYGNVAINPGNLAAYIIYKMKDIRKNIVRVPGFYKSVRKVSKQEIEQLNATSPSWEAIKEETGVKAVTKYLKKGETFTPAILTGLRPSFDVHGIETGYREWGKSKTAIASTASVKFSFRLVAFQSIEESVMQVTKYIKKLMPNGVEWDLQLLNTAKPYLTEPNHPEMQKLLKAYETGFGKKAFMTASGGSIGVVTIFKEVFGTVALLANYGLPDDGMHAPNEKYDLNQIEGGIKTFVDFLVA